MTDQLTVANQLHILGKQNIAGYEFIGIEGGFGEEKKAMLVKEIAEIHGQPLKEVNRRINDNRNRFKDGVDIIDFKVGGFKPPSFNALGYSNQSVANSKNIYLLSERGYAKLLKILEDDTAWNLYDQFVDGYFNMRAQKQLPTDPMSILKLTFDALEGQKKELTHVKTEIKNLKENTPLYATECDEVVKTVNKTVVQLLGGKQANAYQNKSTRDKVYKDIYRELRRHFDVKSYKAIKRRYLDAVKRMIMKYELPLVLSEEIVQINNQLSAEL
nr:ORF6C domain-containing protein [Bacillus cereus]